MKKLIVSRKERTVESIHLRGNSATYTKRVQIVCTLECGHVRVYSSLSAPKKRAECKQCTA